MAERVSALERKAFAIVNYNGFSIAPELIDDYIAMVRDVVEQFYAGVTRYTTSSFLRAKMGGAGPARPGALDEARRIFGRITSYTTYRVALTIDIMFLVVLSTSNPLAWTLKNPSLGRCRCLPRDNWVESGHT